MLLALHTPRVPDTWIMAGEDTPRLDARKQRILFALVREYVDTAQPVGSAVLVRKYGLEFSAATVRHELATLEELGYLVQPHISAGRIPTDKTYRLFVDSLTGMEGLSEDESASIERYYAVLRREVDGLMRETSALLSRLTRSVAVVLAPTLDHSRLKHVDLVPMAGRRVMVVLITDTGRVVNALIDLVREVTEDQVARMEGHVNRHLVGLDLVGVRRERLRLYAVPSADHELLGQVVDTIISILTEERENRVFLGGTANILRQPEFEDPVDAMPVLDLVERSTVLLQLIGDAIDLHRVKVLIGQENALPDAGNIAVVATAYGVGDEPYGSVGLLGPTRMDYGRSISAVRCIADNLSRTLEALHS